MRRSLPTWWHDARRLEGWTRSPHPMRRAVGGAGLTYKHRTRATGLWDKFPCVRYGRNIVLLRMPLPGGDGALKRTS
jgi:hypothetical protein